MATTSRNPFVSDTYDGRLVFPVGGTNVINQGDIVYWDTSANSGNGGLKVVASQANMATYVGVADGQNPLNSIGDNVNSLPVYVHARCRFKTTVGDTFKHLSKVFFDETADAQTVTVGTNSGARTVPVGYVLLDGALVLNGTLTITGAAGQDVQVAITPNYPVAAGYL